MRDNRSFQHSIAGDMIYVLIGMDYVLYCIDFSQIIPPLHGPSRHERRIDQYQTFQCCYVAVDTSNEIRRCSMFVITVNMSGQLLHITPL